jgi:hypothetical protein
MASWLDKSAPAPEGGSGNGDAGGCIDSSGAFACFTSGTFRLAVDEDALSSLICIDNISS